MVGKIVMITGSGSGIGVACVSAFVALGATVCAVDLKPTDDTSVALSGIVDVRDPESVQEIVDQIVNRFGRIDAVVNCAGVGVEDSVPAHELTDDVWDRTIGVNLTGTFNVCRAAVPAMREFGGSLVTVSGVLGLTRTLALDYAQIGIRANAICPGYIDTPMVRDYLSGFDDPQALIGALNDAHPVGRLGLPAEIAAAAVWLASDGARFVTGASFSVHGGYLAR